MQTIDVVSSTTSGPATSVKIKKVKQPTVEATGTKLVVPQGMSMKAAIEALQRKMADEETVLSILETVECFPLDGAHALMKVLEEMFGWASATPEPGFFGPTPPKLVKLQTSHTTSTQVIWGSFQVPNVEGKFSTGVSHNAERQPIFSIQGSCKKKDQPLIKLIADNVRAYVKEKSVYKGKAIRLKTDSEGDIDFDNIMELVKFIDLSGVRQEDMAFSDDVRLQIETSLFTPIEKTAQCRKYGIPLKRGVLLEGPYGTGKTLAAYVSAKKCEENNWTFVYLDRVSGLKGALAFAAMYAPAVVFAEDIDDVTSGSRTTKVNDIMNTIDGIDSKNAEIITILTTNNVDKIQPGLLRPGRLDSVISVQPPDAKAAEKIVRIYARGLIRPEQSLKEAGKELVGITPAVIREIIERSKLAAIGRLGKEEELTNILEEDIVVAARGMKAHIALIADKPVQPTHADRLAEALHHVVLNGNDQRIKGITKGMQVLASAADVEHDMRRALSN